MDVEEAIQKARQVFLDESNTYGCAETSFMVLKEVFGLPDPDNSNAAMALNGGIAYSGGVCGAISGAALVVGLLAGQRIADHKLAKRTARIILAQTMDAFQDNFHTVNCRELIGLDIRDEQQHRLFIRSDVWRTVCMQQIEFVIRRLAPLRDQQAWELVVWEVNTLGIS